MKYLDNELMTGEGSRMELGLKDIFVEGLQQVSKWFSSNDAPYLRSIFDQVGFVDRGELSQTYYVPPHSLSFNIHYPVKDGNPILEKTKAETLHEINSQYQGLKYDYLNKLSANALLFLLEKFGGALPYEGDNNVSIYDTYKIKAAKAVIAMNIAEHKHGPGNLIINVDLSRIQRFIYNISSRGALKNLRSRSFFIELLCNHATDRVLTSFNLHHVNVLMNGGGNINILSSKPSNYEELLDDIDYNLNLWLWEEFNGRLSVVITATDAIDDDLTGDVSSLLQRVARASFKRKNRKFGSLMQRGEFLFVREEDPAPKNCTICNKGYVAQGNQVEMQPSDIVKCPFCERLIRLGKIIPKVRYVYVAEKDGPDCLPVENSYYFLSDKKKERMPCPWVVFDDRDDFLDDLATSGAPFFARTYIVTTAMLPDSIRKKISEQKAELEALWQETKDPKEKQMLKEDRDSYADEYPAMLEYLAESSEGAKLVGALRMDADNMGKILQNGFYGNATLERILSFSRNLNYFFKLHLDSICKIKTLGQTERKRMVHVIYAGGDDLFALGAWNDIADLSLAIEEAFGKYTCGNIDIGISGGFTIHKAKFPVSKMANLSLMALKYSKTNWDPCWFCRKDWTACPLFRHGSCLRKDALTPFFTEEKAAIKSKLDREFTHKYSAEPFRLKVTFKRKRFSGKYQMVEDEVDDCILGPLKVFIAKNVPQPARGFLHSVLRMLDVWYSDGLLYMPRIAWLLQKQKQQLQRKSDKRTGLSMYDQYDHKLHFASPEMLAALHVPLSWAILLRKEKRTNDSRTDGREAFETMGS